MPLLSLLAPVIPVVADQVVTFVRVEKPKFDLVGVVLGAFSAAGLLVLVALALGAALGLRLILSRRHEETAPHVTLDIARR
jgi:hypothetical protein